MVVDASIGGKMRRIIIEGAPAEDAGDFRIRHSGIVDGGKVEHLIDKPPIVVPGVRCEPVTDAFGRNPEASEGIFAGTRSSVPRHPPEIHASAAARNPHAVGRTRRIKLTCHGICLKVKIVKIRRFVDSHAEITTEG